MAVEFPTVLVSAYCDDAHFTGPPADAVAAFRRYAQLTSAKLQNKLRPDKSEVYSPTVSESALRAAGLPAEFVSSKIHSDGMRVLGVPVGTTEYKARFCHQVVKALAADLATLRRVPSLQAQHVILTKSLMHRVTNLLRAIPGNLAGIQGCRGALRFRVDEICPELRPMDIATAAQSQAFLHAPRPRWPWPS